MIIEVNEKEFEVRVVYNTEFGDWEFSTVVNEKPLKVKFNNFSQAAKTLSKQIYSELRKYHTV